MRKLSILLLITLITGAVGAVLPQPLFTHAASATTPEEVDLSFSRAKEVEGKPGKLYSKQPSITSDSKTITPSNGSKIKQIDLVQNGVVKQTLVKDASLSSWTGTVSVSGQEREVVSSNNDTAKGFFAWFRYGKDGPNGNKWYYGGFDGTCPSPSGTSETDTFDMPKAPGCIEVNLKLSGTVDNKYKLSDKTEVPFEAVVDDTNIISASAEIDDRADVRGPNDDPGLKGKTYELTYKKDVVADSAKRFTVYYKQDYNYPGISKKLEAYGARVMVYHAAWLVNITSITYEYDTPKLRITYEGDAPPPTDIKGDFDILPSNTINWRDSFSLRPKDFSFSAGCTYQYHQYRIERDGQVWTSSKINGGMAATTSFSFSNYPYNIAVGSHYITIKVFADCGDSGWTGGKTLTVNGPASNSPPDFSVGWTTPGNWTQAGVQTKVVVGTQLDLVYLDAPAPSDPDGDTIEFLGFDFTNQPQWAQDIPGKYGSYTNGYQRITMDTVGYFCGKGTMRDSFGASTTKNACIQVVEPNPIPVISAPSIIRENHPVTPAIHGDLSYSPAGRSIDHSKDIWVNRQSVYPTPGEVTISLEVFDSTGLKSLYPATKAIDVLPDEPPVAVLNVQPLGIRQGKYDVYNNSYTTDGDIIVSATYRYRYDSNNNGFDDDEWLALAGNLTQTAITPAKVGKYEIEVTVTENYGKTGTTSVVLDTVNLAPAVSFLMEGENETPAPSNIKKYTATDIYKNWPLYQTNSTTPTSKAQGWSATGNTLSAGLGKFGESIKSYYRSYDSWGSSRTDMNMGSLPDSGNGANSLNSYRSIVGGPYVAEPLMRPMSYQTPEAYENATFYHSGAGSWADPQGFYFKSNKTHLYYTSTMYRTSYDYYMPIAGESLIALNYSKIGNFRNGTTCNNADCTSYSFKKWYVNNEDPYDFMLHPEDLKKSSPKIKYGYWLSYDDYNSDLNSGNWTKVYWTQEHSSPDIKVLGYQVADKTIYQLVQWTCKNCNTIRNGSSDSRSDATMLDIRTYDAFTGQLIQSTALDGKNVDGYLSRGSWIDKNMSFTRGDVMIIVNYDGKIIEINREGKIEVKATLPFQYPRDLFRGPNGEWYTYYVVSTNPNSEFDDIAHAVRINSDYTIGWDVVLRGMRPTPDVSLGGQIDQSDNNYVMYVNPISREIVVRSYSRHSADFGADTFYEVIHMDTGAKRDWDASYNFTSINSLMGVSWSGSYFGSNGYAVQSTADGYRTMRNGNDFQVYGPNGSLASAFSVDTQVIDINYYATTADYVKSGLYVGDGIYLAFYNIKRYANPLSADIAPYLIKGTPTSNALPYKGFNLGQFVSTETVDNTEITWTMNMAKPTADTELAGMSFRMTDPRNRYAVESNGSTLYLSKYVNGTRTVLRNTSFAIQAKTNYSFKIGMQGSRIQVYVNDVPYFDVTDTQFASGKFGPFSDKAYVDFSNVAKVQLSTPTIEWMTNYAIWDAGSATADVRVSNVVFTDPENDPRAGNYQWYIEHTPKFLNNQGVSALHGRTLTSPAATFDKVGNYRVTLRAQDDPHPSYLYPATEFDSYRKLSNEYWQILTVHRRPVAQFTLSFAADKSLIWNDTSYDPDRWASASAYSTEATGINYQTTRGILERRYYYKTPSGATVNAKLVTPTEVGTYALGLQVKDEYGAWSYWAEQEIQIDTPVIPNAPPTPGFTLSKTTLYRGEPLTIASSASDPEDGAAANLSHEYYMRNVTQGTGEFLQSTSRGTWTKVFNSLGVVAIRQVVCDSKNQCASLTKNVTIINRQPTADFTWTPSPVYEGDAVRFSTAVSDPDNDPLTVSYEITSPKGTKLTDTYSFSAPYSQHSGPYVEMDTPGTWTIKMTVSDAIAPDITVTKTVIVGELGVVGAVKHTEAWERNRLAYNEKYDPDRAPDVFWAGEAFVLEAATTNTGTSTRASSVTVQAFGDESKALAVSGASGTTWNALWSSSDTDIEFAKLKDGEYTFVFTATYTNGVVKTDSVTIRIDKTVDSYVRVHRLW